MAASITFLQAAENTTDGTSFTFSSQNLGSESADRKIIVAVQSRSVAGAAVTAVTVGGNSCTLSVEASTAGTTSSTAIAIVALPTGTTGDVVVTLSATALRCSVALYLATGVDGVTAHDTDVYTGSSTPTASIDVPADGICVAAYCSGTTDAVTWTNLTESYDSLMDGNTRMSSAAAEFASLQSGLSIAPTQSSYNGPRLAAASFSPSSGGGGGSSMAALSRYYRQLRNR